MSDVVTTASNLPRLANATLVHLSSDVVRPRYDRARTGIGIVHIGPGAFFRGHQAWYTEQALAHGGDWGISVVAMRSADLQQALQPQDGLYTIAVIDQQTHYEVVGAIQELLVADKQFAAILQRLSATETRYVTLTITEKGYCLNADGKLDLHHPDIVADLSGSSQPRSAIGLLAQALAQRHANGTLPFCLISCDNLTQNGNKLKQALLTFVERKYPLMQAWLQAQLLCPCTMVDSITPATDDTLRRQVDAALGLHDAWPIKREAFCQWVIEDVLPAERPAWDRAGAIYASDVQAFEKAKLRLLNAPHSALAYLGSLLGYSSVHEAMQDPVLRHFVERMVREELQDSFTAPKELDVASYSAAIFRRFDNPGIHHLLAQIAWDGSQKLPMRILPAISDNLTAGRPITDLCLVVAAWFRFVGMRYRQARNHIGTGSAPALVDPLAELLLAKAAACTGNAEKDIAQWLSLTQVFPQALREHAGFVTELTGAYHALAGETAEQLSAALRG